MVTPKIIDRKKCIEYFRYKNGKLYYKKNRQRKFIGKRAGQKLGSRNYWVVYMNQIPYLEHRIIYTMLKGEIPEGYEIDHRDNNGLNNNIDNLRIATKAQNNYNRPKQRNNTSGYKGVAYIPLTKKWSARISTGKPNSFKHLGTFTSPQLAYEAYKAESIKIKGVEFWNDN